MSKNNCEKHDLIKDLKDAIFGNGRIGIKDRVIKLEVMMWVIISLLIGNGSLLAWTIKTVNKIPTDKKIVELKHEHKTYARQSN